MNGVRLVLVLVCLAGCATATGTATLADGRAGTFPILSRTLGTSRAPVEQPGTVTGDLSLPAGNDRVPAIIVLHSCAGVTPEIANWTRALDTMGYAALVVDSFTARGVTEVCTGHQSVNPGSRLADLFRAQELLITHPRIDPQRIGVLGFSYGGWVARRRAAGQDVSLVEYEGALHGFDVSRYERPRRLPRVVNSSGCTVFQQEDGTFIDAGGKRFSGASQCMTVGAWIGYDARAHQQSIADLHTFLEQAFASRR